MENTDRIFEYFEKKYALGYLGLIKCISFASIYIKNNDIYPLSIITIAPSGQFKSRTTIEIPGIFANKSLIDIGSDFTIHSLIDKFESGKKCNNKTLSINDLTLLLSSKSQRTKARLINALAEILSEGIYHYGERNSPNLVFEARINIISNITKNSYIQNKKNLLDNTFIERLVPFFYELSDEKQILFSREIEKRKKLIFPSKIKLKRLGICNFKDFEDEVIGLSKVYKLRTLSTSFVRSVEKVRSIISGICIINGREGIFESDIKLTNNLLYFCSKDNAKDIKIVELYQEGHDINYIKSKLGYNSNYPYKVIQKYKESGFFS